jgi:hypothetical protein
MVANSWVQVKSYFYEESRYPKDPSRVPGSKNANQLACDFRLQVVG